MDMIRLSCQCSPGTTPGRGPGKPAPGLSSATAAMTQMTARTVASEAPAGQVRRDPAGHSTCLQGPCRSRRLITYCLQGEGQVADADRTCR